MPHIRIGICSTYAPRACGLATFAADLEEAIGLADGAAEVVMITMVDNPEESDAAAHSGRVAIDADDPLAYLPAAAEASRRCDVVVVQHEFGIYGGEDGEYLLRFVAGLTVPTILTLHTVLPSFSPHQTTVLRDLCRLAHAVTVFSGVAEQLLVSQGIADADKVRIVPHGAPEELYAVSREESRTTLGVSDRFVLSTFGLLSPGKGLELAVGAMADVVKVVPQAQLIIAGRTHPGEVRRNGERYREQLQAMVSDLGLDTSVSFVNEFLAVSDIARLLAATDLFVTPYVNPDQIVSGALTFALAAGCPVVSTPYLYAIDQLSGGAGVVISDRQPTKFASAVMDFALDEVHLANARHCALQIGSELKWRAIGQRMLTLAGRLNEARVEPDNSSVVGIDHARSWHPNSSITAPVVSHPALSNWAVDSTGFVTTAAISMDHLLCLVDDIGIVQHATGSVPLLSSGYCVDDVARLVPIAFARRDDPEWHRIAARSVSFLSLALEDADALRAEDLGVNRRLGLEPQTRFAEPQQSCMYNFMSFDRRWLGEPCRGDHVGRAALGLTSVLGDRNFAIVAERVLRRLFEEPCRGDSLHQVAYTALAQAEAPWLTTSKSLRGRAAVILQAVEHNAKPGWHWVEPTLRYDNGLFPDALIAAGMQLDDQAMIEVGLSLLSWLDARCDAGNHFRFPGHRGAAPGVDLADTGDEQPLEAVALAKAHLRAWRATGSTWHRSRATLADQWYFGRNWSGAAMVDEHGGCFDGLTRQGVNRNQGAESTLAAIASMTAIASAFAAPASFRRVIDIRQPAAAPLRLMSGSSQTPSAKNGTGIAMSGGGWSSAAPPTGPRHG